jgi:hypothetical protein
MCEEDVADESLLEWDAPVFFQMFTEATEGALPRLPLGQDGLDLCAGRSARCVLHVLRLALGCRGSLRVVRARPYPFLQGVQRHVQGLREGRGRESRMLGAQLDDALTERVTVDVAMSLGRAHAPGMRHHEAQHGRRHRSEGRVLPGVGRDRLCVRPPRRALEAGQ